MRRADRVILIAAVLPLALALGGCETSSLWDKANSVSDRFQDMLGDFNPFGTAKKPLPGDRRPLLPEGVPGVQQGVPPELMRGNPQDAQAQPPTEPQPPATKAKSKAHGRWRGVICRCAAFGPSSRCGRPPTRYSSTESSADASIRHRAGSRSSALS